jgi:hypothetical protein
VGKRGAGVWSRSGNLYIASDDKTKAGFWIASAPYLAMPADSDDVDIARAVLWALGASREGVPTPSLDAEPKPSDHPLLRLAGFKGFRTFARGTRHVSVTEEAGLIRVSPSRTTERGSYEELPERVVVAERPSPVELTGAIREGLARCETFGER